MFEFIKTRFHGLGYKIINAVFISVVVFSSINTLMFIVKYHPHQCVYANVLAGRNMEQATGTLDYWGLSYRKALEYILETDKDKIIKIHVANLPGEFNAHILAHDDRKRLKYVNPGEAKYFLTILERRKHEFLCRDDYFSLEINGLRFVDVYKLKKE